MAGEASYSARWAVSDSSTFSGSSVRWDFNSDSVRYVRRRLLNTGLRGTRATVTAQTRLGIAEVGGSLGINPSPKFLGWALPKAMGGGTETAPAFADPVPEWYLLADRGTGTSTGHGNCIEYQSLKINRLALSGRAGGLLDCTLDVFGKDHSRNETFAGAALGTSLAYEPYQHADVTFLYGPGLLDITVPLTEFAFTIDNGLVPRWVNSITANEILEGSRLVTFTGTVTMTADQLGGELVGGGSLNQAVTFTLTNSTVSTVFNFAAMQIDFDDESLEGPEFVARLSAQIRGTTAAELTVANDVTP